ncbi:hypothetical protein [Clostridium intestinale]|uniref:Uncharacterized protein n=1 Tax=Clostridium intestinale URNW TaxID=1294142 RepID=U2PZ09_9CLOT|nr:hypothetical protein [Clostridium intestinale]ERK31745.1 hypothetical protein CINTURNW_1043 [Clostridium intestinale URNW]
MLMLTGVAIVTTAEGKRITYSFSEIDENGRIVKSNVKRSFVAVDQEMKDIIDQLEAKVSNHMNSNQ